jgi:NAD(P)H dehydrogenase (quinone)
MTRVAMTGAAGCTDDVQRLTGRQARSVRELIEANADLLRGVK